ncbi:MAG: hypothetical protein WCG27_12670, partial [Pseudomonadota bacterium]
TYMNLKDYVKAEESYTQCLTCDDPNPELFCCLGASLERQKKFDEDFISLARAVYQTNDQRFAIKNQINQKFGSEIQEVKSYKPY